MSFTIVVTLNGRRDGRAVPNIGRVARIGNFRTKADAAIARDSWLADPVFNWSAEVVRGSGDRPEPSTHKRRRYTPRTFVWRGRRRPLGAPHAR